MALLYDGFLLTALWFVSAGLFVLLYPLTGLPVVETNGVETASRAWLQGLLFPLLILETWGFYAWFWLHGGQTLGMRAWRLELRGADDKAPRPMQTMQRFAAAMLSWALLGLGWLMAAVPPHRTLHDRLSGTEVLVRPKVKKTG
jgi:uncharacterized RDD family membrane protein YckC